MKSLQDALYNWLTIKVVVDARPDDRAAKDTYDLFETILLDDHSLTDLRVERSETFYTIFYRSKDENKSVRFPIELIDIMINQMEDEPEKFPNFNSED